MEEIDYVRCSKFVFDEESCDLTKPMLKELIFREIAQYSRAAKEVVLEAAQEDRLFFPLKPGEFRR